MTASISFPSLEKHGGTLSGNIILPLWNSLSIRPPEYPINDQLAHILKNHIYRSTFMDMSSDIEIVSPVHRSEYEKFIISQQTLYDEVLSKFIVYYNSMGFANYRYVAGGMDGNDTPFVTIDTPEQLISAQLIQLRGIMFIILDEDTTQIRLEFDVYWSSDGLMVIYENGAYISLDTPTYL